MEKFSTMPSFYKQQTGSAYGALNENDVKAPQNAKNQSFSETQNDGGNVKEPAGSAAGTFDNPKTITNAEQNNAAPRTGGFSHSADAMLSILSNHAKRVSKINRGK